MSITRSFVYGVLFTVFTLGAATAQVTPADPAIEKKIQHIQDELLPAVIVKGEPVRGTKLADRMAALHVPGVSIAVIHNGQIEWARGFGAAKIGGAPVTPDTLFQAASISKPVAAMAVLHLAQAGKLSLDTDVNRYLKTWKLPENEFTAKTKVTLRQLLTHTAGMTVHGFPGYASNARVPSVTQVLNGEKPANTPAIRVDTIPGTNWRYSGGGYVITQQLLEDLTGKSFPGLMQEIVLGPIGMSHSTYEQPLPKNRLSEAAMAYDGNGAAIPGGPHTYPEMAPAGLWTTPSDLARYALEVQKSLAGKSSRVISAATARQMLTPGLNRWGLGPQTGGNSEHPWFAHGGANEGFRCNLISYENGDGAIVMTNSDNGGPLTEEIIRTIAREYHWPDFQPAERSLAKVDSKVLDAYPGLYRLQPVPAIIMTITRDGDQLYSQLTGQGKLAIFPSGDREFFLKEVDAQLTFSAGEDGKVTQVILHQNGQDTLAPRLSDSEAKQMTEQQARVAKKFKYQTQDPRTEAALRRLLEEIRNGRTDFEQIAPESVATIRGRLAEFQSTLQQHGALQKAEFRGVGPAGADIYDAHFANGNLECRIMLTDDGKVMFLNMR